MTTYTLDTILRVYAHINIHMKINFGEYTPEKWTTCVNHIKNVIQPVAVEIDMIGWHEADLWMIKQICGLSTRFYFTGIYNDSPAIDKLLACGNINIPKNQSVNVTPSNYASGKWKKEIHYCISTGHRFKIIFHDFTAEHQVVYDVCRFVDKVSNVTSIQFV